MKTDRHKAPDADTRARLIAAVGADHALTDPADMAPYLREWRDRYIGRAALVLRPGNRDEIAAILKIANDTGTAIVPQGGNTGLVGGQTPFESGHEVVVSMGRLNAIRDVDLLNNTITVEAGCVLANVQQAAADHERLFPLSLGAQGSCQIGGNLSSNAGGTGVLAYGNARDLVLGLEVVLPDGRIWEGLRALRKDNTGYDLKNLFIGAEGTLGIITAAVLKLFARPGDVACAFAGLASPDHAVRLLALARALSGNQVTAFEIVPRIGMEFVLKHAHGARDPLGGVHDWYVLMELSGGLGPGDMRRPCEAVLEAAFEAGLVEDAAIAESGRQRSAFWALRADLSEMQKHEGGSIKHDVSVPVSHIAAFIEEGTAAARKLVAGCRPVPFGHIGDGNIHFNISQPEDADEAEFLARWDDMNVLIHKIVLDHGGSISAEHGIGRLKRDLMREIKSPVELDTMRALKRLFDPNGILNPGKTLP